MSSEETKAIIERQIFSEFLEIIGLYGSFEKPGRQSEPDILFEAANGEKIYFELVEICENELAEDISQLAKGKKFPVKSRSNPIKELIEKKIQKNYKTDLPVELICYTNGRVIPPDDVLIDDAYKYTDTIQDRFRKIWLLGEKKNYEVWPICREIKTD